MNMKKISIIVAAMTLALGLSQCKKEQPTTANGNDAVAITLDIKNNGGSRMDVNTSTGEVTYETGDVIYVASGGTFIGTLTHNGTNFAGTITNPTVGEPLDFYFLGNVTPAETLTAGTTTTCSVVISDQTEHLPVIEYAPSNETYTAGATTFTAHLLNKCALVKFNVTTSSEAATCITGMKNKVTVDFSTNTLTHGQEGNGVITLSSGSGERWAILLPQDEVDDAGAYSGDGNYTGTCETIPTIMENGYLTSGIQITISTLEDFVDLGLPSGTLWATCNVGATAPEQYGNIYSWYYNWGNMPANMPTSEQCGELIGNTTGAWTTRNGINGWLFSAQNGNTLFLPAAGYQSGNAIWGRGVEGNYWSKTPDPYNSNTYYYMFFRSSGCGYLGIGDWGVGFSVRQVQTTIK